MCTTLLVDPAPRDTLVALSVAVSGRGDSQLSRLGVATVYYLLAAMLVVEGLVSRQPFL